VSQQCPPDIGELAERYHLGHLSPAEAAALEEHCLACARCTAELERAGTFVDAMRAASRRLREKKQPAPAVSQTS